jgi:hypothetical protein
MKRIIKALNMTVIAACGIGLLVAAPSSGTEFHSSVAHTILSGSQIGEDVFTFNAGTVKCKSATYSGTRSTSTTTTIRLAPSYSECTAFGFVGATVHMNKCEYDYVTKYILDQSVSWIDIVCPESKVIEVTAFNCALTIGPQKERTTFTPTVIGSTPSRLLKLALKITGIAYVQHSKSFPGCSSNETKPRTEGSYQAEVTVSGTNTEGSKVDLWHE